jgi:hypothetical protein
MVHTSLPLKELTEHSVQVFWAVSHILTVALASVKNRATGHHQNQCCINQNHYGCGGCASAVKLTLARCTPECPTGDRYQDGREVVPDP